MPLGFFSASGTPLNFGACHRTGWILVNGACLFFVELAKQKTERTRRTAGKKWAISAAIDFSGRRSNFDRIYEELTPFRKYDYICK